MRRGAATFGYRVEHAVGRAFEHVAVSARLKTDTVARAKRPEGGDVLALGRLEATMARLAAEAAAAVVRPSRIPTAAEARVYLE